MDDPAESRVNEGMSETVLDVVNDSSGVSRSQESGESPERTRRCINHVFNTYNFSRRSTLLWGGTRDGGVGR